MNQAKLRFSIVIPCYNEARFISRTLASLQQQNFSGRYEVIVVDNNCTDKTVAIAKSYGARIVTETHPGVCWARQAGTEAANGEIVISTDADTTFSDSWLQTIDQTFHRKNYVAVTGPCAYSDGPWWGKIYPKILFGTVSILRHLVGGPFYVTATNIAFKKTAWEGYNTVLTQGGDEVALLHALRKKGKVAFNNANPVFTSGRRLYKGLVYNFFVTFLVHYLLAYYANKLLHRTVIGMAPAYRSEQPARKRWALAYRSSVIVALILLVSVVHLPKHDSLIQQSRETFAIIEKAVESYT